MHSTLTRGHFATQSEFPIILFRLCLYYIGQLLRRHENHIGLSRDFCDGPKLRRADI